MTDRDEKLSQLGEILKLERQRQGMSHDEIMEITKISRRSLVAIEEGDRDELPHPVYAKGFIKNFAGALGLPWERYAELLANAFDLEEEDEEDGDNAEAPVHREAPSGGKGPGPVLAAALAVVLALLLGGLVWYIYSGDAPDESPEASKPVASVEEPAQAPAPEPQPVPVPQENAEEPPRTDADAGQTAEAVRAESEAVPEAETGNMPVQAPSAAPEPEAAPDRTVLVKALPDDSCWMQVRADGGEIKEYFIRDGHSVRFTYATSLWIRLGNAGGVSVSSEGRDYPLDASPGQVRTLRFGDVEEQ